jgi:hypothetical protein
MVPIVDIPELPRPTRIRSISTNQNEYMVYAHLQKKYGAPTSCRSRVLPKIP